MLPPLVRLDHHSRIDQNAQRGDWGWAGDDDGDEDEDEDGGASQTASVGAWPLIFRTGAKKLVNWWQKRERDKVVAARRAHIQQLKGIDPKQLELDRDERREGEQVDKGPEAQRGLRWKHRPPVGSARRPVCRPS